MPFRRRYVILLSLISFVLASPGLIAAHYFVSSQGDDSLNGTTVATAWCSVSRVNGTPLKAGDTVSFEGGQTFAGPLQPSSGGTTSSPITFTSYGTGRATISIMAVASSGFDGGDKGGVTLSQLNFIGVGPATSIAAGISFYRTTAQGPAITLTDIDVTGFNEGVGIGGWEGEGGFSAITIERVNAWNNKLSGIFIWGQTLLAHRNVTVRGCKAWNNHGSGARFGNGILLNGITSGLIEHNLTYNNNGRASGGVGLWTYGVDSLIIQFNESYDNFTNGSLDGGGFDFDGGTVNCVMQYNYSHGNAGAGYLFAQYSGAFAAYGPLQNNVVRYNISENDGRKNSYGGIVFFGLSGRDHVGANEIYNNTVYTRGNATDGTPSCIRFIGSNFYAVHLRNNLLVAAADALLVNADDVMPIHTALLQGNNYWAMPATAARWKWGSTTYATLDAWRTASNQEKIDGAPTGLNLDPLLMAPGTAGTIGDTTRLAHLTAYRLQTDSPLINQALNLNRRFGTTVGTRDFFGTALPVGDGYDIGAHELALAPHVSRVSQPSRMPAKPLPPKLVKTFGGEFTEGPTTR